MLLDFVELIRPAAMPLHEQLTTAIRGAIAQGRIDVGQKLPSIRRAAAELKISRTTVEIAYQQLCLEGYVESRPQSGFYASAYQEVPRYTAANRLETSTKQPRFDLRSGRVDASSADTHIWQKQMRAALTRQAELISYGDPQGEEGLRQALATYAFAARGVRAQAQHIVIGAGIQPLITLLLSLLRQDEALPQPHVMAQESPGFRQAEQVCADFGWLTQQLPEQEQDWQRSLEDLQASLYLYLPSRRAAGSPAPEAARRKVLLGWLHGPGRRYIIEDDYNGELRYQSRPLPALQCLDREGVIYIGSFSKLLLPSIRIAYMVLPPSLWHVYKQKAPAYNQSAGKIEQMALETYIEQDLLEKHLRRLRKIYLKKSQLLRQAAEQAWGNSCELLLWETDLSYLLTLHSRATAEELAELALNHGVALRPAGCSAEGHPRLLLNFAGIEMTDIEAAVEVLAQAFSENMLL